MRTPQRLLWASAALITGGFYLTPYLAIQQLRSAAAAQDAEGLGAQVDFPALRASLKTSVQARLAGQELNERGEPTPAAAMGAAIAGALLGPMVDALVTPASLGRLLQGQAPAAAVFNSGRSDRNDRSEAQGSAKPPSTEATADPQALETRMAYESLNRFVFSVKKQGADEDPVHLVLHRKGLLAWQLAELRLP
jgi:hypothetical protein